MSTLDQQLRLKIDSIKADWLIKIEEYQKRYDDFDLSRYDLLSRTTSWLNEQRDESNYYKRSIPLQRPGTHRILTNSFKKDIIKRFKLGDNLEFFLKDEVEGIPQLLRTHLWHIGDWKRKKDEFQKSSGWFRRIFNSRKSKPKNPGDLSNEYDDVQFVTGFSQEKLIDWLANYFALKEIRDELSDEEENLWNEQSKRKIERFSDLFSRQEDYNNVADFLKEYDPPILGDKNQVCSRSSDKTKGLFRVLYHHLNDDHFFTRNVTPDEFAEILSNSFEGFSITGRTLRAPITSSDKQFLKDFRDQCKKQLTIN